MSVDLLNSARALLDAVEGRVPAKTLARGRESVDRGDPVVLVARLTGLMVNARTEKRPEDADLLRAVLVDARDVGVDTPHVTEMDAVLASLDQPVRERRAAFRAGLGELIERMEGRLPPDRMLTVRIQYEGGELSRGMHDLVEELARHQIPLAADERALVERILDDAPGLRERLPSSLDVVLSEDTAED